jgi:ketosteroid isomerase-like protein
MSQENLEVYARGIDALNRRDLDACLALMDADVEAVSGLVTIEGGYHGHDGIRRLWQGMFDIWPDFTAQIVDVRSIADLTLATLLLRGHGAGSRIPLEWTLWSVARWRRGKVTWWGNFPTRAEALEAAGLSEQDTHTDS